LAVDPTLPINRKKGVLKLRLEQITLKSFFFYAKVILLRRPQELFCPGSAFSLSDPT